MSIYLSNPDAPPDSEFEAGKLYHFFVGNRGRMLDPRRTPICIVKRRQHVGTFVLQVNDFEDTGAQWEIDFEKVSNYQFARGRLRATDADVNCFRAAADRFIKC